MLPVYFETYFGVFPEEDRRDALDRFTTAIRSKAVLDARAERREMLAAAVTQPQIVH